VSPRSKRTFQFVEPSQKGIEELPHMCCRVFSTSTMF